MLTVPTGATMALVQAETQAAHWTDDGTNPTSTTGMVIFANDTVLFSGAAILAALKFIEKNASGQLNVSYYR